MQRPLLCIADFPKVLKETFPSPWGVKDPRAEIPTVDHMVNRTRVFNPDFPWHKRTFDKVAQGFASKIMNSWTDLFVTFLVSRGMPQLAPNAGARIAELQAELDAIKGAGPSYAPGGGGGEPQGVEEMGHMEAARRLFG